MVFFYGDGAGAAVLERRDEPGFLAAAFQADGTYAKHWRIFAGGTAEPATRGGGARRPHAVQMLERYPPEINDEGWPRARAHARRERRLRRSATSTS